MLNIIVAICVGLAVLGGFFGICWFIGNFSTMKGKNASLEEKIVYGAEIVLTLIILFGGAWLIGWLLLGMKKMI